MKPEKRRKKAVFLDRDGVVNPSVGFDKFGKTESPLRLEDFRLFPWTSKAIKKINRLDLLTIIVTNQPAIAKGKMSHSDLRDIHKKLLSESVENGYCIDEIFVCLHHPDPKQVVYKALLADCDCRKPKPGMLLQAAQEFNIDLAQSWTIGDSWRDIEAGQAVGCRTILVRNDIDNRGKKIEADFTAENLLEAAYIIEREENTQ